MNTYMQTYTQDYLIFLLLVNCLWTHFKCHSAGVSSFHRRRFCLFRPSFERKLKKIVVAIYFLAYSRTLLLFKASLNHGNFWRLLKQTISIKSIPSYDFFFKRAFSYVFCSHAEPSRVHFACLPYYIDHHVAYCFLRTFHFVLPSDF